MRSKYRSRIIQIGEQKIITSIEKNFIDPEASKRQQRAALANDTEYTGLVNKLGSTISDLQTLVYNGGKVENSAAVRRKVYEAKKLREAITRRQREVISGIVTYLHAGSMYLPVDESEKEEIDDKLKKLKEGELLNSNKQIIKAEKKIEIESVAETETPVLDDQNVSGATDE